MVKQMKWHFRFIWAHVLDGEHAASHLYPARGVDQRLRLRGVILGLMLLATEAGM